VTPDDDAPPATHTDDQDGTLHAQGKEDPLANCVTCHGVDLGGDSGPTCYGCHDNEDHTSTRDGVRHLRGDSSSCATCHGPDNSGGLGPACSECHRRRR